MPHPTLHPPRPSSATGFSPPRGQLNASQLVLLSFMLFILVGTGLLMLPVSHAGAPHAWVDDLFIAASAVCVTGLATLDLGTQYSLVGQLIIMGLIQIGGLGYMTLFTASMLLIGQKISMRDKLTLQQATDQPGLTGLTDFILHIIRFTLAMEGLGFLLIALHTVPELGWRQGLYMALFHAVSAFNNAGFSLFAEGAAHWQHQGTALVVISLLVIVGGLGYNVNHELVRRFLLRREPRSRWNPLMTIVLGLTAVLLVGSTLLFWFFEHNNAQTLAGMSGPDQAANAFFMAVQPRTAGFNSVDMGALDRPSSMLMLVLMFIGAGPGGTAGGIKLTTLAVILAALWAAARGRDDVTLPFIKRRVSEKVVHKAYAVAALSIMVVVVTTILLACIEPLPFLSLLFEATSAFATVGLSVGITGQLSDAGKLLLVGTMLAGRVGVLVIMLSIFSTRQKSHVRYAEEPLLVG